MAVPFARPVPTRELTLLRNPLRFESKAAAAFREEATAAFLGRNMSQERKKAGNNPDGKEAVERN